MIQIKNLTMDYGDGPVLDNINLHIRKGEAVTIIGGSGCGKSTLLRCMNKLITPTSGEILIEGENILAQDADLDRIRRRMGMVYQSFNLFSHLTVLENVMLAPLKVAKVSPAEAKENALKLLAKVGMAGRENQMPSQLSGGQKQRVAIARTLAMHPDLILFDEPTSALDPTMVDEVESVILDLVSEGMTSVIVTHEMSFARNVSSRVVFLAEKGIYEEGTPEEIFDNPRKPLTQRFLYRSRMLECELNADSLDLYGLRSDLNAFIAKHEHGSNHDRVLSAVCDELIAPAMKGGLVKHALLRLVCSANGSNHMLFVVFDGLAEDPLSGNIMDDLNRAILEHYAGFVFSRQLPSGGWEVCIQM